MKIFFSTWMNRSNHIQNPQGWTLVSNWLAANSPLDLNFELWPEFKCVQSWPSAYNVILRLGKYGHSSVCEALIDLERNSCYFTMLNLQDYQLHLDFDVTFHCFGFSFQKHFSFTLVSRSNPYSVASASPLLMNLVGTFKSIINLHLPADVLLSWIWAFVE